MKSRVLLPNGKFAEYKGKRYRKKIKTVAQKELERKQAEHLSNQAGVAVENPVKGGLHPEDMIMLNSGEMTLPQLIAMSKLRNIPLKPSLEGKDEVVKHILAFCGNLEKGEKKAPTASVETGSTETGEGSPEGSEEGSSEISYELKQQIEAGLSIAEMKEIADDHGIAYIKSIKSADLKALLLADNTGSDEL